MMVVPPVLGTFVMCYLFWGEAIGYEALSASIAYGAFLLVFVGIPIFLCSLFQAHAEMAGRTIRYLTTDNNGWWLISFVFAICLFVRMVFGGFGEFPIQIYQEMAVHEERVSNNQLPPKNLAPIDPAIQKEEDHLFKSWHGWERWILFACWAIFTVLIIPLCIWDEVLYAWNALAERIGGGGSGSNQSVSGSLPTPSQPPAAHAATPDPSHGAHTGGQASHWLWKWVLGEVAGESVFEIVVRPAIEFAGHFFHAVSERFRQA